jgi:hypothetical protein
MKSIHLSERKNRSGSKHIAQDSVLPRHGRHIIKPYTLLVAESKHAKIPMIEFSDIPPPQFGNLS